MFFTQSEIETLAAAIKEDIAPHIVDDKMKRHDAVVSEVMTEICEDFFPGMVVLEG